MGTHPLALFPDLAESWRVLFSSSQNWRLQWLQFLLYRLRVNKLELELETPVECVFECILIHRSHTTTMRQRDATKQFYDPLPQYRDETARNQRYPGQKFAPIGEEADSGSRIIPLCMALLAVQVVLLVGNAFMLRAAAHTRAQHAVQWLEPSQLSRDAHEILAIAVVVRLGKDGAPEIFTRKRPLHADGRNEMYAGRWEGLGKPIEHGESLFNALQPEFSKFFDMDKAGSDFEKVRVLGLAPEDVNQVVTAKPEMTECAGTKFTDQERVQCRKERDKKRDRYFVYQNPYVYVQALQGSIPWTAIGMITFVEESVKEISDFQLDLETAWWPAEKLLDELMQNPSRFVGLHYPVLLKAALDLKAGRFDFDDAKKYKRLYFNRHENDGHFSDLPRDDRPNAHLATSLGS